MRRRRPELSLLVTVSLVLPFALFAGCAGPTNCAGPGVDGSFTGRVTGLRGDVATFVVESVHAPPITQTGAPAVGQTVTVQYPHHDARALHVDDHYRVVATADAGGRLVSSVNRPCVEGTTWPDGSYIRTGSWWKRNALLVLGLGLPGALLFVGAIVAWRRRVPAPVPRAAADVAQPSRGRGPVPKP